MAILFGYSSGGAVHCREILPQKAFCAFAASDSTCAFSSNS
jgi:hypothetical protein